MKSQFYITDTYKNDQIYIKNGTIVSDRLAYHLDLFALEIKDMVTRRGEIYNRKI